MLYLMYLELLDKEINKTKTVLEIITILEGIIIILISFSSNFYLVSFLTILLAIFGSCHYGLLDSITSFYACNTNINYSSIRIFGSCAYIVGTTLGGYVTKFFDFKVCFIIAGILFIICGGIYKSLLKEPSKKAPFVVKCNKYKEKQATAKLAFGFAERTTRKSERTKCG